MFRDRAFLFVRVYLWSEYIDMCVRVAPSTLCTTYLHQRQYKLAPGSSVRLQCRVAHSTDPHPLYLFRTLPGCPRRLHQFSEIERTVSFDLFFSSGCNLVELYNPFSHSYSLSKLERAVLFYKGCFMVTKLNII